MTEAKGDKWYDLPEAFRERLLKLSKSFYTIKEHGLWTPGPGGYEPGTVAILRVHVTLTYDVFMPALVKLMEDGVLTAIFPVGMKTMDIVFHQAEEENPFDQNAYHRADIERKGEHDD